MMLFVYGDMLEGLKHHAFLIGARAVFKYRTWVEGFMLYDGGFGPAMYPSPGAAIKGEVREVPAANVSAFDRFEGHPRIFKRTTVECEDGRMAVAYVFQGNVRAAVSVPSGDWLDYVRRRPPTNEEEVDVPF